MSGIRIDKLPHTASPVRDHELPAMHASLTVKLTVAQLLSLLRPEDIPTVLTAENIRFDPEDGGNLVGTETVDGALDLIDADITVLREEVDSLGEALEGKAPMEHRHMIADIDELQDELGGKALIDHTHATSDVVGLDDKFVTITQAIAEKAPMSHAHAIADVSQLQTALDSKASLTGATFTGPVTFFGGWAKSTSAAAVVSASDFNNLTTSGQWSISGTWLNAPPNGASVSITGTAEVHERYWAAGCRITQIVNTSGSSVQRYIRVGTGADGSIVWSPWEKFALGRDISALQTMLEAALAGKAPLSHTHALDDVIGLATELTGKAPVVHTHAMSDVTGLLPILDKTVRVDVAQAFTATEQLQARINIAANNAEYLTTGILGDDRVSATLTQDKAFRQGNILGAVSMKTGVPFGALIERGENENGNYVRFADGTQICWNYRLNLPHWNGYKLRYDWVFPIKFFTNCACSVTPTFFNMDFPRASAAFLAEGVTLTGCTITASKPTPDFISTDTIHVGTICVGRWA